jgi:hypothetical protein
MAKTLKMKAPGKGVKVRMYRTGLGDCFLMAFPSKKAGAGGAFYMLVDCGVFKATPAERNAPWIKKIVENIRDATAGKLDLLVITHEHWDHVSAFHSTQARAIFEKEINLGALWLAWTEDRSIKMADDLHKGLKAARLALGHALARLNGMQRRGLRLNGDTHGLIRKVLEMLADPAADDGAMGIGAARMGAADLGAKSVQTEETMGWIRTKYGKGKTEFLHPGQPPVKFEGVADARVYVLGPPEDPVLIKRYNPSASHEEVYPKAMAAAMEAAFFAAFGVVPDRAGVVPDEADVEEARRMSLPFDRGYQIPFDAEAKEHAGLDPFFAEHYLGDDWSWRQIEADWLEAAGEFALQMDNATNNTSLAFALEVGPPGEGNVLLFPGDAQVGNWQSWFGKVKVRKEMRGKDMAWKVGGRTVTADDLLRRTVLYKVGHHGSHNATLRAQGLEKMGPPEGSRDFVAFLPVDEFVARKKAGYGEMPLRSLVKELAIRTDGRVARNDEGAAPDGDDSTLRPIEGAPALRSDFLDASTELYFEYTVKPPA